MIYDVKEYRIPNSLILLGYISACVVCLSKEGLAGLGGFFVGAIVPVLCLIWLQYAGILGGGDVKLLSVAGGFLGVGKGLYCIVFSFVFGAVLSLIVMIERGILKERILYFLDYIQTVVRTGKWTPYYQTARDGYAGTIHFSMAIMASVLFLLWK